MNNNKQMIWAKTLLNAYKYLGTLCESIDKLINLTAKTSFYTGGRWIEENSILNISQKIIKLSDRKIDYINLKIIIEKALSKLQKKLAKLLILRYVNRINSETISKILKMSERTFYRKTVNAIEQFAHELYCLGYNSEKLEVLYLSDLFISSIYEKQEKELRLVSEKEALSADEAFKSYVNFIKVGVIN